MNTSLSLPNRLPKELTNIPYGQIIILTNPAHGLTAKHIVLMEFIYSMAGQYAKPYLVNAMPIDCPELYDCVACKVKTDDGDVVLISDKKSLVEMLSEFWGLDYDEVCKTIRISGKKNKPFVIGGENHPVKIPISNNSSFGGVKDGFFLQLLPDHTREGKMKVIRGAFQDIFNHNLEISLEDIQKLFEDVKKNRKTYILDIQVKRNVYGRVEDCFFKLIDNCGNEYPFKMQAQEVSLYLTYILFKDGWHQIDVADKEFYDIFTKIHGQFIPKKGYSMPTPDVLQENFKFKRSNIVRAISSATDDNYAVELFAIDGHEGEKYRVAGATEENRAYIKKEFGIE